MDWNLRIFRPPPRHRRDGAWMEFALLVGGIGIAVAAVMSGAGLLERWPTDWDTLVRMAGALRDG